MEMGLNQGEARYFRKRFEGLMHSSNLYTTTCRSFCYEGIHESYYYCFQSKNNYVGKPVLSASENSDSIINLQQKLFSRGKLNRHIHLCEFREKVRQYCINRFVRTTLLSKNIILFENNTYILVKKFGRRTLRESDDSVKHYRYIYQKKTNWARSVTRAQSLYIIIDIYQ